MNWPTNNADRLDKPCIAWKVPSDAVPGKTYYGGFTFKTSDASTNDRWGAVSAALVGSLKDANTNAYETPEVVVFNNYATWLADLKSSAPLSVTTGPDALKTALAISSINEKARS